ncbi:hypothetical protein R0137_00790 [Congregibacter brevis]|uniref:Uncharacterized protein n=1 Tax=Congregibacter brevis TaxID=3081201 RepID=A0ABZ0IFM0_9GAMM|nr:hypothetical protein R0137_00790 [Congregibacter sp. IMCC45268]
MLIARLYNDENQARAAAKALVEAGYSSDDVAVMEGPKARNQFAEGEAAPTSNSGSVSHAVRVGSMLGDHADFYMSRLTEGRTLVVTTPPFIASRMVEVILDEHNPLPDSHVPTPPPFVPISEQSTPLSNMLGLPVLVNGTLSEAFGFSTQQDGLSHFSRWFKPLASDFTFSSLVGWKIKSSSATPLSSMLNLPLKSDRVAGKSSSFGMPLLSKSGTPLSSMLGLRVLSKRNHYLYS